MICNTYKAELREGHTDKFLVWTQVDGGSLSGSKVFVEVPGVGRAVLVKLTRMRTALARVQAKNGERYPATIYYAERTTTEGEDEEL